MEEGGWIRRMFEAGIELKKRHGADKVFDLSLGNPITEPPGQLSDALVKIAKTKSLGKHRYMPNAGYTETRDAVARALTTETGLPFAVDDVVMTCGAAGGLNVILETILDPGDEVVIFAPFFGEFIFYIENHLGKPVVAPTNEAFQPDLATLEDIITSRTRAVLVNSPNNPSGVLYPESTIIELGNLIRHKEEEYETEIFLISDEPYRRIIFDDLSYPHIYTHHNASIAIQSHSKDLAVPGERIGYISINPSYSNKALLLDGLIFWNRSLGFVNAPAIMQQTVTTLQGLSVDVKEYQKKRDYLLTHMREIGYDIVRPQGAFYMFPKSPLEDDVAFVAALREWNVLTVPGRGFGKPGYFRIAYCVEDLVLEGAMAGFAKAAKTFT